VSKIVIFGIDGASPRLIEQWRDELPNLRKMMESGVFGELESTIPPVTCPAWPCMFTGKNPGKLGMYFFTSFSPSQGYDFRIHNSADWHSSSLWKILNDCGKEVGLLNIPMTFPAHRVNTFMVAGGVGLPMDPDSTPTYPPSLKQKLDEVVGGYRTFNQVAYPSPGREDAYIRQIGEVIEMRTKAARYVMNNFSWDLFICVFTALDQIQHFFWRHMDESHPYYRPNKYQNVIKSFYQKVDRAIGELIAELPAGTNILVTSDHGFGGRHGGFMVNNWLERNGFLAFKAKPQKPLVNRGLYGVRGFLLRHLSPTLIRFIISLLPKRLLQRIATRNIEKVEMAGLYKNIDWSRTRAFGVIGTGIYLNLKGRQPEGIVEPEDYDRVRNDIIEKLAGLIDPWTGEPISPSIFKKEEVYHGEHADSAPDISLLMGPYTCHAAYGESEWIGLSGPREMMLSGTHRLKGIFVACGPDVRKDGRKLPNLKIYDIAPTVLHMFGLPVDSDMDGRVLAEIFREDSEPGQREVAYRKVDYEAERVKRRVRELKKLKRL